ncbi:MAG: TadE family protein [Friedmanniella sp.]
MPFPNRDQRGLSESVQLAVIWPVLLFVTLGIIQAGIWLHARNVAERAAAAAVDTARGSLGRVGESRRLGMELARAGGLENVSLEVSRSATSVTATLTADAPLILDLGLARLQESASAPVERVTPP